MWTLDRLALGQNRHGGVIAVQPLGSEHVALDQRVGPIRVNHILTLTRDLTRFSVNNVHARREAVGRSEQGERFRASLRRDVDRRARMSECEGGTAVAIQVVMRLWQLSAVAATPALSPSLTSVVADGADALVDAVSTPFVNLPARLRPTDQSHTVPTLPFVSSSAGLAVRRAICERGCRWH
jgi:hypothetical protein